ncbi:hypothetical protein OYT13_04615 [Pandoraea sp. XJJ-1]|uniref:hypothetical protein n=1 Tax=Pandoraea sp. XJJ-1 TaxID=3002643 RepID=UPI0022804ABE|nr:hypothetical protein [Pandoraea sp. XJJ-1]WAL83746.1 hypothetical protein OYT13_04615 [Pandoraea sp. XJJ-1]
MTKIVRQMYDESIGAFTISMDPLPVPTLEESIDNLGRRLVEWINAAGDAKAQRFFACKAAACRAIDSDDDSAKKYLTDTLGRYFETVPDDQTLVHATQAFLLWVLADRVMKSLAEASPSEQDAIRQRVRKYLDEAQLSCNATDDGFYAAMQAHAKRKRASNAGKKNAERYMPAKLECIRLLKAMRPEEGWRSRDQAAQSIEPALAEFIEQHPELKMSPQVHKRILIWFREDAAVRGAFGDREC